MDELNNKIYLLKSDIISEFIYLKIDNFQFFFVLYLRYLKCYL